MKRIVTVVVALLLIGGTLFVRNLMPEATIAVRGVSPQEVQRAMAFSGRPVPESVSDHQGITAMVEVRRWTLVKCQSTTGIMMIGRCNLHFRTRQ